VYFFNSAAKNIILMGVKSVTLYDPNPAEFVDLSAQFYLGPLDVGKPRATTCAEKLAALNQYVRVSVLDEPVSGANAKHFHVIVACDQPLTECLRLSELARSLAVKFVATESFGVFGRVFCDFGDKFRVDDVNGENPVSVMIAGISKENPGLVATFDEMRHGLQDGDYVTFSEVSRFRCHPKCRNNAKL
jgi:ubiquitin-activating enzyme E1